MPAAARPGRARRGVAADRSAASRAGPSWARPRLAALPRPARPVPAAVEPLRAGWRWRNVPVMSRVRVTGRVGFGRGGPPRRGAGPAPKSARSPSRTRWSAAASRVSAAYESLISAMRRVAAWTAVGSSPVRSGWFERASRRQAALIWAGVAPRSTPRTRWGSRFATPSSVVGGGRTPALDSRPSVPSPNGHGIGASSRTRRGARRGAARPRVPLRARLSGARRVPAPAPARDHAGRPRACPSRRRPSAPATSNLPAWFIPARGGQPGPGVALVHGWESARDRTLPNVVFLHAAGFHCLTIDVRGHGANPAETLPISAGEFGLDALATFEALVARPEVTVGAVVGHSMGAIGAILAGAADPRVAAVVATSGPADPYRLTRQTFHLANLPIPDPIAYPARLADDPGLPGTARPHRRGHQREPGHRALPRPGPARPRRRRPGRAGQRTWRRLAAAARASRPDARRRAGRDAGHPRRPALVAVRVSDLSGDRRALPDDGPRRTAHPRRSRDDRGRDPRRAHPRWREPLRRGRRHAGRLPDAGPGRAPRRHPSPGPRGDHRPIPASRLPPTSRVSADDDDDAVWKAVRSKRAIRRFADRPLEPDHLERILNAGRRAHSSKNQQRWAFVVCQDRAHLQELSKVGPYAGHLAGAAVGIALVIPDPKVADAPLSVLFDIGQAADSMMLVAWELGIGSVPATVYRARPRASACSATRTGSTASSCCRSAIRPTPPT